MKYYTANVEKPALIDALTNMIDENIRKGRCGTYDEWQAAVKALLDDLEYE